MSAALLHNCLLFSRQLRRAGIPVSPDQTRSFVQALNWIDLSNRDQFFYTARALLISRAEHLRLFVAIFHQFWRIPGPVQRRRQPMPRAPRHRLPEQPFTIATYMAYKARLHDPLVDITDRSGTASSQEQLRAQDFSQLSADELEQVQRMIERLRWQLSQRTTRRRRLDRRGRQLALRAVVRDAARHGGVPTRLLWQRRTSKPRPLVILADISGSMERYSRLLLQLPPQRQPRAAPRRVLRVWHAADPDHRPARAAQH